MWLLQPPSDKYHQLDVTHSTYTAHVLFHSLWGSLRGHPAICHRLPAQVHPTRRSLSALISRFSEDQLRIYHRARYFQLGLMFPAEPDVGEHPLLRLREHASSQESEAVPGAATLGP